MAICRRPPAQIQSSAEACGNGCANVATSHSPTLAALRPMLGTRTALVLQPRWGCGRRATLTQAMEVGKVLITGLGDERHAFHTHLFIGKVFSDKSYKVGLGGSWTGNVLLTFNSWVLVSNGSSTSIR